MHLVGKAGRLVERDRAAVWHPYAAMPSGANVYPVVSAEGTRLRFADGREVIDGMSSWWAVIHGYRHPVLDEAITRQLGQVAHVMLGGLTHPPAVELAERLVAITPASLDHVFFSDSGSVAVEVAMKMAIQYWTGSNKPAKRRLIAPRGGYHGDTLGAMSVCDPETGMHRLFGGAIPVQLFAEQPGPDVRDPFDDRSIRDMARMLDEYHDEVAAVILEPIVQGAGGMRFYRHEYLQTLRQLCDRYDVLLIADEIATGFGRTGALFACEHAGIAPDILCVGKALTGGYLSMAATLCTSQVADGVNGTTPGVLMHGPTFMGNPLAAAVSLASIDLLLSQDWQATVRRIETALEEGLAPARGLDGVADVRVFGAIGVIEMQDSIPIDQAQARLVDRGVWLRPFGKLLYSMPPYVITDEDLGTVTSAMVDVARSLSENVAGCPPVG